jgi:hypothetical protein
MSSAGTGEPTSDVPVDENAGSRGVWIRRVFLTLLAVIVVLALFGFFGVHSRSVAATSGNGDLRIEVHYAQVARAGLAVPFDVTVTRRGGFSGDVSVAVSSRYLELFDRNSVDPEPAGGRSNDRTTTWRFDEPHSSTFVMTIDMQVQAGQHFGRSGFVTVRDDGDGTVAHATFKTWLAP